jgi:predicted outer membrane repeat protein
VMTLKNTIVANSVADANCFGTIADGGGNLSYPDTSCPGINADPVLGPLQDNGGPTLTMEPGPGSPAIDTGNDATCAADPVNNLDQRGVVRPQGTHCDIGAVEHLLPFRIWCPLVYAQPASASTLVSVCDEAHLLAAISGGGTITFDCSGAITLTTPITITANTTIDGSGQDVTISGNHAVRVFKVNYGATLNLNGLTIANGSATSGAGVLNYGTLALDNSTFSGNSVTCDYCTGGGIFNIGALSVSNSTFSGNSMPGVFCNGGDIANRWGTVTINNSSFSGNTVNVGGAIFNQSGAVTVTNSTFSGETAGVGGAIANGDGRLMVSNCTFSGNRVWNGGGIYNDGTLIVSDSGFFDNSARYDGKGGGIYSGGTADVSNSTFSGNTASDGGAIKFGGGTLTVSNSTFSDNSATATGGGIHIHDGILTVSNSVFSENQGHQGGGITNWLGTVIASDSTFSGNRAYYGGGIYNYNQVSEVTLNGSTFSGNTAARDGGGIYNASTLQVSNSTFSGNSASGGGGIYNDNRDNGTAIVSNSTFSNNRASSHGGGVYDDYRAHGLTLGNAIATNNSPENCFGPLTDGGGNLSYPDTSCPGINADPMLGPLQNNGGPTWTMALGEGSAALDAADDAICAAPPVNNLDQRGVPRPWGAHCDIGAVEQVSIKSVWLPVVQAW